VRSHLKEWLADIEFTRNEPERDHNGHHTDELSRDFQEQIIWGFEFMKKRFEQIERRYEQVDKRHERLREDMKIQFDRTFALTAGMFFTIAGGFIVLLIQM